eukprot:TRINITY_DN32697_c0_g1_i1.p1 TRINITY_DN32697_c0_g1~~TRINITY_DN32697_c0_g1_i1.p1  ORF type:complete len:960 (+),score=145.42 TRINITY_DN32697_c0_g1_i1:180-2882(+)
MVPADRIPPHLELDAEEDFRYTIPETTCSGDSISEDFNYPRCTFPETTVLTRDNTGEASDFDQPPATPVPLPPLPPQALSKSVPIGGPKPSYRRSRSPRSPKPQDSGDRPPAAGTAQLRGRGVAGLPKSKRMDLPRWRELRREPKPGPPLPKREPPWRRLRDQEFATLLTYELDLVERLCFDVLRETLATAQLRVSDLSLSRPDPKASQAIPSLEANEDSILLANHDEPFSSQLIAADTTKLGKSEICNSVPPEHDTASDFVLSKAEDKVDSDSLRNGSQDVVCINETNTSYPTTVQSISLCSNEGNSSAVNGQQMSMSEKLHQTTQDGSPDLMDLLKGRSKATHKFSVNSPIAKLLSSTRWDIFIASTILSNTLFMGVQIDYTTSHRDEDQHVALNVVAYLYTFIFTLELVLRMTVEGIYFFSVCRRTATWNYLDFFIVGSSLFEVYADLQDADEGSMSSAQLRIVRTVRITRLMKIFRIARLVRFIRALRTLVNSILCTLKSVFWALLLMVLIIYVFSMVLCQAVNNYLVDVDESPMHGTLILFWGSLLGCMLTLLKTIIGGISWHDCLIPLESLHIAWSLVFLSYVVFMYFAVLNVITGVFCESAIQSAKNDQELVIQEQMLSKKKYVEKLQKLFEDIDDDGSKNITLTELERHLDSEISGAFFQYLELDVSSARDFLKLIDMDGSGDLDLGEFIEGIYRLRGPAKALDIAAVAYDQRAFQEYMYKSLASLEVTLLGLCGVGSREGLSFADGALGTGEIHLLEAPPESLSKNPGVAAASNQHWVPAQDACSERSTHLGLRSMSATWDTGVRGSRMSSSSVAADVAIAGGGKQGHSNPLNFHSGMKQARNASFPATIVEENTNAEANSDIAGADAVPPQPPNLSSEQFSKASEGIVRP